MTGTLFTNGRISTLDPAAPSVKAIAVAGGLVVASGRTDDLTERFPDFRRIDLGGRRVVPGFVDSHIHLPSYGLSLHRINLQQARSLREAVDVVAAAVRREARPGWLRGRGWDKNVWPERRWPTNADLDLASPNRPVALTSKDGHLFWVNSAALRLAGIDRQTPDPPGGEIMRDPSGEPTGILKEEAKALILAVAPPIDADTIERSILDAAQALHRLGITGVHSFVGTEPYEGVLAWAAYQRLHARGALKLRVWNTLPSQTISDASGAGLRTGLGDAWLRVGPVKIFADGALGSQTASMLEPLDGQPTNRGIAIYTRDELIDLVGRAMANGFWCAIHAIGDRANRWVLDAFEAHVDISRRRGARHRIEHVQLLDPDDLPRLARLQIVASMQPIHATSDREIADRYWGRRSRYAYPWRSLLAHDTHLAFGSDAPVETPDVLQGLYAAATRRRVGDSADMAWYPQQTLTVREALHAYTVGAAYASGQDDVQGTLTVGKRADFAVLDQDILQADPQVLLSTHVSATIIDGEIVFAGPGFSG